MGQIGQNKPKMAQKGPEPPCEPCPAHWVDPEKIRLGLFWIFDSEFGFNLENQSVDSELF